MIDEIINKSDVGDVLRRALDGERLSVDDGVRLFESDDLPAIGAAANEVRRRWHGDRTYYVVNRHINYTDVCRNHCAFCAFSRVDGQDGAYLMTVEDIVARAQREYDEMKFTELHIVGGCHPNLRLDFYTKMLSTLRALFPDVHIQAFTAVEIANMAKIEDTTAADVLSRLQYAGLGSLPGGGAEVFSPRVRGRLCPEKIPGVEWLEVMREAHRLGLKSNSTMLYGHIETYRERIEHMVAIRELQDEAQGFMTFIPLKFHPSNTQMSELTIRQNAIDDLKVYAISRLMLDNVPHIKVFWIMLGIKLAQVALSYGADDFDGTVVEEKITHRAGAETPEGLTVADIQRLIRETGTKPVERSTLYQEVIRDEAGVPSLLER